MTTEDEAVQATRAGLKAAGVPMDADGRVLSLSHLLASIAEEGGGVIDAGTAMEWSVRIEAGEHALVDLGRRVTETTAIVRTVPEVADLALDALTKDALRVLSRAIPQFIYGASMEVVAAAAAPLLDLRKAEEGAGS